MGRFLFSVHIGMTRIPGSGMVDGGMDSMKTAVAEQDEPPRRGLFPSVD